MMLGTALDGLGPALAAARRHLESCPHWVWPLAVCAAFIAVGLLVADDYPVTTDTLFFQRPLAIRVFDFVLGDADALPTDHNKLYGMAFEVLPLLVERIAGLDDTRSIYLTRHLMTHLLFISGGFCCYLLAYRMTGSRLLGLFAMLLFLLHPRIYGQSFFNSKDIPFLSMFMVALLSVHWAFRKGTIAAFVVCGAAVAILFNLRIMGIMLLPAVLAMRACDVYFAVGWAERRRVLISGAAFAVALAAIYYASFPYLWADPLPRFGELMLLTWRHPAQDTISQLFQGEYISAGELHRWLPAWIGITTPPWTLLLALAGAAAAAYRAAAHAGAILRNTQLRFELLVASCAILPIAAVVITRPVLYDDWRQVYFLWGPLCLLAALGLRQISIGLGKALAPRPATIVRYGLAGLVVIAIASVVVPVIRLHPYQYVYFNLLVDRTTPEYLKTQYVMDYVSSAHYEGYQYILETHPVEMINVRRVGSDLRNMRDLEMFPQSVQSRFNFSDNTDADYYVLSPYFLNRTHDGLIDVLLPPVIYSKQVYNSTIMTVVTPHLSRVDASIADTYREIYRTATLREPTRRGNFDLYLHEKTLTVINEDCPPGALSAPLLLSVYAADANDLARIYRNAGHIIAPLYGVRFDGICLMQATLPDFDITHIAVSGVGAIVRDAYLPQLRRQYAALQETEPVIRSGFAVYMADGVLRYTKDECGPDDKAAQFYLHLIPVAAGSLPPAQREYGFANRDFSWDYVVSYGRGIAFDGKCIATVPLPDYEIHGFRTGQYIRGAGRLWSGEFYTDAYNAARASELAAQAVGEPAARNFFSVYHSSGALTYIREDCAPSDTAAPFYLHIIPSDANNLPAPQREHGFDNRDFEFGPAGGVQYQDRCLVSISLPDYAIDRIRTGQYRPETGRLWTAEFAGQPTP